MWRPRSRPNTAPPHPSNLCGLPPKREPGLPPSPTVTVFTEPCATFAPVSKRTSRRSWALTFGSAPPKTTHRRHGVIVFEPPCSHTDSSRGRAGRDCAGSFQPRTLPRVALPSPLDAIGYRSCRWGGSPRFCATVPENRLAPCCSAPILMLGSRSLPTTPTPRSSGSKTGSGSCRAAWSLKSCVTSPSRAHEPRSRTRPPCSSSRIGTGFRPCSPTRCAISYPTTRSPVMCSTRLLSFNRSGHLCHNPTPRPGSNHPLECGRLPS